MDAQQVAILEAELIKARKRLKEQGQVLDNNRHILNSPGMEVLKAVARRRMPKLQDVFEETTRIIAELEQALLVSKQGDLIPPADQTAPSNSSSSSPPRRR